jgi:potassium/hydrogen antiporter
MLVGARGGDLLFGTAFIVVMVSLLIQGWTVAPLARWLRLDVRTETPSARPDIDVEIDPAGGAGARLDAERDA